MPQSLEEFSSRCLDEEQKVETPTGASWRSKTIWMRSVSVTSRCARSVMTPPNSSSNRDARGKGPSFEPVEYSWVPVANEDHSFELSKHHRRRVNIEMGFFVRCPFRCLEGNSWALRRNKSVHGFERGDNDTSSPIKRTVCASLDRINLSVIQQEE